jgi:hypothetical protein
MIGSRAACCCSGDMIDHRRGVARLDSVAGDGDKPRLRARPATPAREVDRARNNLPCRSAGRPRRARARLACSACPPLFRATFVRPAGLKKIKNAVGGWGKKKFKRSNPASSGLSCPSITPSSSSLPTPPSCASSLPQPEKATRCPGSGVVVARPGRRRPARERAGRRGRARRELEEAHSAAIGAAQAALGEARLDLKREVEHGPRSIAGRTAERSTGQRR